MLPSQSLMEQTFILIKWKLCWLSNTREKRELFSVIYVWCRVLDRSQACCQQTHPAHSACTTTTRQESAKEIWCLQAETRQQETSIRQWYLQPFRCTGAQFKGCRWELDRTGQSSETPFIPSNWSPRTSTSQRLVWWEMTKKSRDSLKRNTKHTRHTTVIAVQFLARLPIQIYVRQPRLGSETYKTHGWAKRLMKSSPLQAERIWRSSLMHLRQYMVPGAREPHHSLVQMELFVWLTRKLSWKDGLNTLIVSLIRHHLSMLKISTDYHRSNKIRCLMTYQPSLKQWKQ